MHYNADDYLEAHQPPTYTHHGCTYHGRVLSFDQWIALTRYLDVLSTALRQIAPNDELAAARTYVQFRVSFRRIIDAIFPRNCRVVCPDGVAPPRRGWLITRPARVSDLVEELPLAARTEAVRGFIRSQERLQQPPADPGETTTISTPPTPEPPPTGSASAPIPTNAEATGA